MSRPDSGPQWMPACAGMTVFGELPQDLWAMELPKYSQLEIERRFRVVADNLPSLEGMPFSLIEDWYINGTRLRVRLTSDSRSGVQNPKLCKKYETHEENAGPIVNFYVNSPAAPSKNGDTTSNMQVVVGQ